MSWLFASDGQSIGASSALASLPNEYLGLIFFTIVWFDLQGIL